jgi:hypothetical protein
MLTHVRTLYVRLAERRIVVRALFLTTLGLVAFVLLDARRPAGSPGAVALQLAFSRQAFADILDQWGTAGVRAYQRSTLSIDYLFPIAYALCLSSSISWLSSGSGSRQPGRATLLIFSLPWAAAALDYTENTLHLILLRDFRQLSATLVLMASLAAAIKWGLITFCVGVILRLLLGGVAGASTRHPGGAT